MEVEKRGKLLIGGPGWWAEQQRKPRKATREMGGQTLFTREGLGRRAWESTNILVKQVGV